MASSTKGKLSQPTHLILDYDGTITVQDTMAVLGSLPKQPKMSWQEIVNAYMKDYQTYKNTLFPWDKHDRNEYSKWLASRKWVEAKSAQRVQDAGFFRQVTLDEVHQSVSKCLSSDVLQLRKGWKELIGLFLSEYSPEDGSFGQSKVSVLSVNWSESAIRRALWEAARGTNDATSELLCRYTYDMEVHANEIEGLASPYGSSGRVCRPLGQDIRTSDDKLRYLPVSKRDNAKDGAPLVVYVGDSSTDFDSLCAADLGVWLCDVAADEYEQCARDTFKPLKYIPPPLHSLTSPAEGRELFYWAPDLETVSKILCSG